MDNKIHIYCAGGWFSKNQDTVLTRIEGILRDHPGVIPYFPRHDGVKLSPNEFHDHNLRKKVFEDNVKHIESADFVVAALDGRDGFYDTGTVWEVGYATAHDIPVIAFDTAQKINDRFSCFKDQFYASIYDYDELVTCLDYLTSERYSTLSRESKDKVLFIGPTDTEDQMNINEDLVSLLFENCGKNIRWLDQLNSGVESIDKLFEGVEYLVAVIDDRHPIVSWVMGQAYERGIPIITYTNYDYTVNIMLLFSIVAHCKGKDELRAVIQKIKRTGIGSLEELDTTSMKAE